MIKVSLLQSSLHDSNEFSKENKVFLNEISKEINDEIVISNIDDYDCDLKLIFISSGGSEGLFKENFPKLKAPYYLLTTGSNNSLAASLEILTYLNSNNYPGEILHGDISYICSRINALKNKKFDTDAIKLGVIGKPSDWLIASTPDYKETLNKLNIKLIDIDLEEVINKYYEYVNLNKYNDYSQYEFNNNEVLIADQFYNALVDIVKKYDLKGLTIRCFDLLDKIHTTGCLALAKLNSSGIIGTCEGDIASMISMYLIKKWFNKSSFQANPSKIDVTNNEIIFAHCTLPLDMCLSYKFNTHFESKIGLAIKGELKKDKVTVFRLSKNLKDYFVSSGEILSNLNYSNLCRTQINVKMNNVQELLVKPCGNHHIVFYGDYEEELKNKLKEIL